MGESGIVSIFSGFSDKISNIKGTLLNETTSKQIRLYITGLDPAFSKLSIYAQRSYSDLNGIKTQEFFKFVNSYDISGDDMYITISGYELTTSVSQDIFNVKYHVYDAVATSTQIQNRLFFGNVKEHAPKHDKLATCALNISVKCVQNDSANIGYVDSNYQSSSIEKAEYYNAKNIYNFLGYWPDELYRIAVVYIYDNDTLSDAYSLKGCCFSYIGESNLIPGELPNQKLKKYDLKKVFINDEVKYNTKGVFQMPDIPLLSENEVCPIGLEIEIPKNVGEELKKLHIKGLFFVRQARIPIALAQGLSIGVSKRAHTPTLSQLREDGRTTYIAESILNAGTVGPILSRTIRPSIVELSQIDKDKGISDVE